MKGLSKTGIPYADYGWPLVTGCSNAGPACDHCYAARYAATRGKHLPQYAGLASRRYEAHIDSARGTSWERTYYGWTGEVRFHPELLDAPLHTKKPGRVFTVPTGDLFHEGVTDTQIGHALDVMEETPHLTYIIVTKRMERLQRSLVEIEGWGRKRNPLSNVILLPTVWDQESADRVIPLLLATPAAVRGVSLEPMLGAVDLTPWLTTTRMDPKAGLVRRIDRNGNTRTTKLDLVVLGGETGPGARRMHARWAVDVWKQCRAAGVPFYWKQAGSAWMDGDGTDDDDDAEILTTRELPAALAEAVTP